MTTTTRVRSTQVGQGAGSSANTSSVIYASGVFPLSRKHQKTISSGHPFTLLGRVPNDIGGSFLTQNVTCDWLTPAIRHLRRNNYPISPHYREYIGPLYPSGAVRTLIEGADRSAFSEADNTTWFNSNSVSPYSDAYLDGVGATAISRVTPTNPIADVSTTLAEILREGLPSLPGQSGNVGSEYLNVVFGIQPLISEYENIRKAAERAEEVISQLERDAGRWIRRRYEFPLTVTSSKSIESNAAAVGCGSIAMPSNLMSLGTRTTVVETEHKLSFSGCFTYYIPKKGWRKTLWDLDRLYGIVPGVSTIYNLTPWSWLVDYFSNTGNVIQNLETFSQDGVIMPYGYVMSHKKIVTTETWQGNTYQNGVNGPLTTVVKTTREIKQRRPATPFGFGFDLDGLTLRQSSILVALGISRA